MIIDKTVNLIINNYIKKYYINLGYNIPKYRDPTINIKITDLHKNSNVKIHCKCDICNNKKYITYQNYNKYISNQGYYSCNPCSDIKKKKTKSERYSNENYNNPNKYKKTNLERYGFEHSSKNKDIRNKNKQTCLNRYGVEHIWQSEEIRNKIKITNNKRYGVDNPTQNKDILLKSFKTSHKIKNYKNTKIHYQGSYELDFLEKYFNIGINNCKSIKYIHEGKEKIYFPDFYYKHLNLIIEIKSSYTYNVHKDKNISKEKECINKGYNYIKIVDKNYIKFDDLLKTMK